ncbi:MAG: DUF5811 family protein [Natrialbaceae archaeon]|nr:DUF5811 family protein [Natrialbaceae archaeon]
MNGNNPYGGLPGELEAGKLPEVELSSEQHRAMREDASEIAELTREYLPDEYMINAEVITRMGGPQVAVAVRPPIGTPVSAGVDPTDVESIDAEQREEVAKGLAASAALQVKLALEGSVTPAAR